MTTADFGDVCWPDELPIEPTSFYVMDRGNIDFRRLRRIAEAGTFFIIRERPAVAASRPVDRATKLRLDPSILINGWDVPQHYAGVDAPG